jgi:hypothetical protein
LVTGFSLIKEHLRPFIKRIGKREGTPWSVLLAGGLMVFTKSVAGAVGALLHRS